ncbi:MAG: choice-of-anchor D domain-containing protein, partial [Prosthecobacter sp.]
SFSVTFNPSTLGVKSAVLHILSNDADENPFDINLTGIGLSQAIFQQGANDPFTGLSYTGSQDVWLYINGPSTGTESRNTGADVRVITGGIPSGPRRALMRFDLASLAGRYATIHKVTLRLHWQSNSGAFAPVADSLRVYRVASANGTWVEGDGFPHLTSDPGWSTWSHRIYSSTPWAGSEGAGTAGTDYVNTVIGSKAYNLSEVAGTAFDIVFTDTSFINDWVAGNNSGLFLRTITENGQAIFHSSESTTAALRPELLIDFTPSGAPELDVEQPAGASLADGGNKDFGSVSLGATSSLTFTLKNSGDQNLTGLGITIDGAEASDFTVTAAPVAPVSGPGGSTTFTVQFAPGGAGQRTAALHIASNDADENPFDIILRGTGIGLPEIVVEYPFGVSLTDGSSTVAWGNSAVGTPVARTFILKNTGSAALNLTGASVDGANAGDFTLGALAGSIPAGGSVNLSVTFNASSVGAKSAALHLLSNDADESPFDIILTGNSRFETIYQQGAADPFTGKPYTGMEDTWLFTNGPSTGTESRNTGADERIVAGGIPDGPRHALLRFNVASLAGKFTSISKVTLRLYWRSNSAAFASVADTVQVFRVSAANKAWVEGNGFSGDTASAGWSTWGHRLHATTPWAGSVGANTPGTDYASTPLGTRSYDLSEVAGDAFEVVFTDTSFISEWLAGNNSGLYLRTITENGQANFHSSESTNAALRPQLLIEYTPVTGSEILVEQPAGIPLSDGVSSIDFGHLNTGTSVARTFIIRNLGSANLTGLAITKNGAHATNFTVGALGATSLAPGASTTFEVTFNPSAGGVRTAAIHIASNDANEKAFDIALMGIGIAAPEITVEQPANTSLVDGTSSVAFGNIALGKFSTLTFTIRNQGAVPLTGIAMTKDGANSGDFTITGPDVTALAPAASKTFTVKFTPGAATLRTAAIHITSNDDDEAVFDIALTGTGVIKPVVNPAGPFSWFVSGTVTDEITAANHPTSFTITGLPAAMTYDKTTGQLSGKPNAATTATKTFTVVASNIAGSSSAVTFSYTVTALPVLSMGTFNGLIDRSTLMSGPVAGQMLKGHGGSLSNLVVTSTGTFTATLNLEEKGYKMPAAARLDAATGGNPTASVVILRGTAVDAIPDLTFAFAINKDTGELTGTLSDGVIVTPVALKAWRSPWKATGTVASPANPATAASYTAALELDPALAGTDPLSAPPGNPANVIYPQGTGYVTLTITTAGVATWNGKAADGTPLTASTMLGPNGEVPLHFLLYTPMAAATAGSLHGWTKITGVNLDSVAPFDWLKLAQLPTSTTRSYKDGFPLHSLTVIGSKYVKPTAVNLMLGLLVPPNNAQLVFSEGGIKESTLGVSGALTQIFSISATNVISGLVGTPGVVTLTPFSATTGAISGNFTLSDDDPRDTIPPIAKVTRSTPWTGVLVPRLGKGVGQFQLAKLPTNTPPATTPTNSPQLSGQVVLEAP